MIGVQGVCDHCLGEGDDAAGWGTKRMGGHARYGRPATRSADRASHSGPRPSSRPAHGPDRPPEPADLHCLSLRLPRVPSSVSVARHLVHHLLEALEVDLTAVDDLATAVSEAATNAVQHARRTAAFDVDITVNGSACTVRVADEGPGFDPHGITLPAPHAEGGRGLSLMQALVDGIEVISTPGGGSVIHMTKRL